MEPDFSTFSSCITLRTELAGRLEHIDHNQLKLEVNKFQKFDLRVPGSSLDLAQPVSNSLIAHPCIVICMLQLLLSVEDDVEGVRGQCLQLNLSEVINSLVRSERNQQK